MLGDSLKFSFATSATDFTSTTAKTTFYFPKGRWCQIYPVKPKGVQACTMIAADAQSSVQLPQLLDSAYVHLREGHIVPYQDAASASPQPLTVTDLNSGSQTEFYGNLNSVKNPLDGTNTYATGYVAFDADNSGDQAEDQVTLMKVEVKDIKTQNNAIDLGIVFTHVDPSKAGTKYVAGTGAQNLGKITLMGAKQIYDKSQLSVAIVTYIDKDGKTVAG